MSSTPQRSDERQTAIVAEHLHAGYGTAFDAGEDAGGSGLETQSAHSAPPVTAGVTGEGEEQQESSLRLPGGDIHRGLYKIKAAPIQRSKTFSHPPRQDSEATDDDGMLHPEEMLQPQGFRRQFVMQKHRVQGGRNLPITRNFIEFLDLYGSFAGEDLAESDEEALEFEEEEEEQEAGTAPTETRPLLGRRRPSTRPPKKGDSGMVNTFFTTVKAFIGTGIMFLPKAFKNGGILFSSLAMLSVAAISMLAFHLLLACRARYGGGYGDIGREIAGPRMRALILGSITLSQLGFVCTGLVFVADNWHSFLQAVTNGASPVGVIPLIAVQAAVIIPLSFIRNISKLGPAALIADVFIVIGLVYIYYYDIVALSSRGMHPSVELFNPDAYTMTIGASIFTFEGIGLVLPIQSSMRNPERFEPLLGVVMLIITVIFTSIGALCYATFGSDTQIEVIDNFPQDSRLVNAVQVMYALAVLVGNPVQLFPAMRILEHRFFGDRSGKKDLLTKWKKNAFRSALVAVCVAISIAGSANLDRFVALIGSLACVPLVYIYPPYLHYKGVATSRAAKIGDLAFMTLGAVGMVYTTTITVVNSFLH
ncbi:amino acid transporter [Phialemonium atrogriseum]|uniref:Amino acid transporter n=1 Tax=Phialemonium atrogriseum TaxID=1093897 RepID=A0AAJ0BQN9_9PEZI|nr:amino acid transporter [Phialemonium atrogriseum]KAK1762496.1 amino acid transporter [Phialemonium atrogriseum]